MARAYLQVSTAILEHLLNLPYEAVVVGDAGTPGVVNLLIEHPSISPDAGYVRATYRTQQATVFEGFTTTATRR